MIEDKLIKAAESLYSKGEITSDELSMVKEAGTGKVITNLLSIPFRDDKAFRYVRRLNKQRPISGSFKAMAASAALLALTAGGKKIIQSKPVRDITTKTLKKVLPKTISKVMYPTNRFDTLVKNIKPVGFGIAAATGIGYGGKEIADSVGRSFKIHNSYKDLVEKNPLLGQYSDDTLKEHFDVVKTFSPKAASNPLVASALVHKMLEFGGVDHKLVQDIAAIEARKPTNIMADIAKAGIKGISGMPNTMDDSDF